MARAEAATGSPYSSPPISPGERKAPMKRSLKPPFANGPSGSTRSCLTYSTSHLVPMSATSALTPPAMSVVSFCWRLSQFTTSTSTSRSGCVPAKAAACRLKYGSVAAL